MDSQELKTKLLHYWRFKRRYFFVATEAGKFNSDVLISNEKEIIEIEVKISKADLDKEFKKKKHSIYEKPSKHYSQYLPNRFFIAVPSDLVESAKIWCDEYGYGIIEVLDKPLSLVKNDTYCRIAKPSKIIQTKFKTKLHKQIVQRASSELIRIRLASQKI